MLSPPPSKGVRRDWRELAGNRGFGKDKSAALVMKQDFFCHRRFQVLPCRRWNGLGFVSALRHRR